MGFANDGAVVDRLAAAVGDLDKRQAQLKRAVAAFKKGAAADPCAAHRWLKTNRDLIEREMPALVGMADEIEGQCRDAMLSFEAELRDALTATGYSISGQWPRYYVEHVILITIEEDKCLVTVGEDRLQTFATEPVVASVKAQLKKLKTDPAKLNEFLRELYEAYKTLDSGRGETVSIWDLYREVVVGRQPRKLWRDATAANFRQFTEAEFRANLTALLKSDQTTVLSRQLRLLPPISKDESVFIYQPAENRFAHVGRVQFMPISGGGRND